jgi:hypothetical protein
MSAALVTRAVPGEAVASSRATLWWARIVALSIFGPYITGSARTEQMTVFGSALLVLVFGWPLIVRARSYALFPFLVMWGGICAVMLVASLSRPASLAWYGSLPASHAVSFMALPLALMTVTWFWTLTARPADLVRAVGPVVVAAMCANAVVSLFQLASGNVAVVSFLPRFWDNPAVIQPVAVLAGGNSRYTGIFDQPAEAGIAYGVALLLLIWLARQHAARPAVTWACAALLVTGGALTISKVFVLAAVPLAVLTVLRGTGRVRVVIGAGLAGLAFRAVSAAGWLPSWNGPASLAGLTRPGSLVATYSAGRYGPAGSLNPVVSDVLHSSPAFGFGARGLEIAYDSLWVEILVVAGVAGVILLAAFLAGLAWRWLMLRDTLPRADWLLAGGVLGIAIGASPGLPSLTANRAASLLWLVAGPLLVALPVSRQRG